MEYTPNTEYYSIVNDEQLNTILPDFVVDFMGYPPNTYKLIDVCHPQPQPLGDGNYMINIQLTSASEIGKYNVNGYITQQGFELATQFYTNIFTNISDLKFKYI